MPQWEPPERRISREGRKRSVQILESFAQRYRYGTKRERESEGGLQCKLWSSEIHTRAEERERERIKRQQFMKAAYSRPTIEVRLFQSRRRSKKSGKD